MKKILSAFIAVLLILGVCSCNITPPQAQDTTAVPPVTQSNSTGEAPSDAVNYPNASKKLEGSCAEIIADVYSRLPKGGKAEVYLSGLINIEVTNENADYYIGVKEGVPYTEGIASESDIQPVTYSFVIIKLGSGDETYEAYRSRIEKNINIGKWVCMGAQEGRVLRINNVIAVIMGTTEVCDELQASFMALAE